MIKADGLLFIFSGILILADRKVAGALTLLLAVSFVLLTKDNPWIKSNLKTINNERNQRGLDFMKDLSLIGGAILLLLS